MPSLSEYAALIEQSPILIWRANKDALCDYFNQRWYEFRGRTLEQEYGNGWQKGCILMTLSVVSRFFWIILISVKSLRWNIA